MLSNPLFVILLWVVIQVPQYWSDPARWAQDTLPQASLMAALVILYTANLARGLWAALWDVPMLCPCFNQKKPLAALVDNFLVLVLQFWRFPNDFTASVLAATAGDLVAGVLGYAHMRFPPHDQLYYTQIEARFRTRGCVTGLNVCPYPPE